MVNIYLNINDRYVHTLSVPLSDIQRLSVRPVKWLQFVTFTVCGVQGDLSETPNGCPVNHDTSLAATAENYYYTPQGDYQFINLNYNALSDQITASSVYTLHSSTFRKDIMERDGLVCVFTGAPAAICDATHIISKAKGDAYIAIVLEDRHKSYNSPPQLDLGINSIENGIFLSKNLHALFSLGHTAFLKTPNFALDCDDIPRVEEGPMPPNRLTLQHLTPDTTFDPIQQRDARITGTGISLPPNVLLDFVYGVAAYKHWGQQEIGDELKDSDCYQSTSAASEPQVASDHPLEFDDDENKQQGGKSLRSDEMLQAMDDLLRLSMVIKGITPEMKAAQRKEQEEAAVLHAKEDSQRKVQQWHNDQFFF